MDPEAQRLSTELECLKVAARHFGHRVNNLITEVHGQLSLLKLDAASDAELVRRLDTMQGSLSRMAQETQALHRTARAREDAGTPFPLTDLRDMLAAYLTSFSRRTAALELEDGPAWSHYAHGRVGLHVTTIFGVCRAAMARVEPGAPPMRLSAEEAADGVDVALRVPISATEFESDDEIEAVRTIAAEEGLSIDVLDDGPNATIFRISIGGL